MILTPSQSAIGQRIKKMPQFGYKIYCLLSVILVVIGNIGKLIFMQYVRLVKQKAMKQAYKAELF